MAPLSRSIATLSHTNVPKHYPLWTVLHPSPNFRTPEIKAGGAHSASRVPDEPFSVKFCLHYGVEIDKLGLPSVLHVLCF